MSDEKQIIQQTLWNLQALYHKLPIDPTHKKRKAFRETVYALNDMLEKVNLNEG